MHIFQMNKKLEGLYMKKIFVFFACLLVSISISAQDNKQKFSPEKFRAEMEQFITKEACLTPKEASKFFPLYSEMTKKQRVVFDRIRQMSKTKPADEAGCRDIIKQRDKLELELKKIQQTYHERFMTVISAKKLFDVIRAEEKFHRRMLKKSNAPVSQGQNKNRK